MPCLRVVSYNIHKARGLDGRVRIERTARVLQSIQADIVALQEVVSKAGPTIEDHQAGYLAKELGLHFAIGQTRDYQGGAYGNVILSRWGFQQTQHIDLSVAGREERGVLRADIRLDGGTIHIFNAHLGTGHFERRKQAKRLVDTDLLKALDFSGPRMILGDFNEWTHGRVTRTLRTEFHLTDLRVHLPRRRVYPHGLPLLHLDHIYYDRHFQVQGASFYTSPLALIASDHLPLMADFIFDEKER